MSQAPADSSPGISSSIQYDFAKKFDASRARIMKKLQTMLESTAGMNAQIENIYARLPLPESNSPTIVPTQSSSMIASPNGAQISFMRGVTRHCGDQLFEYYSQRSETCRIIVWTVLMFLVIILEVWLLLKLELKSQKAHH